MHTQLGRSSPWRPTKHCTSSPAFFYQVDFSQIQNRSHDSLFKLLFGQRLRTVQVPISPGYSLPPQPALQGFMQCDVRGGSVDDFFGCQECSLWGKSLKHMARQLLAKFGWLRKSKGNFNEISDAPPKFKDETLPK